MRIRKTDMEGKKQKLGNGIAKSERQKEIANQGVQYTYEDISMQECVCMCGMYGDGDEWKLLPRCIPWEGREGGGIGRMVNNVL